MSLSENDGNTMCSNDDYLAQVATVSVNGVSAGVFAFCDPSTWQLHKCTTADIYRVGGGMSWTTKPTKSLHGTFIVIGDRSLKSVTFAQLVAFARSLKPVVLTR
jgi:hypothetical protein